MGFAVTLAAVPDLLVELHRPTWRPSPLHELNCWLRGQQRASPPTPLPRGKGTNTHFSCRASHCCLDAAGCSNSSLGTTALPGSRVVLNWAARVSNHFLPLVHICMTGNKCSHVGITHRCHLVVVADNIEQLCFFLKISVSCSHSLASSIQSQATSKQEIAQP